MARVEGSCSCPQRGQRHAREQDRQAQARLSGRDAGFTSLSLGQRGGGARGGGEFPPPPWSPWVSGRQVCVEQGDLDPLAVGAGLDPARVMTCAHPREHACLPQPVRTGVSEPHLGDEGADSLPCP